MRYRRSVQNRAQASRLGATGSALSADPVSPDYGVNEVPLSRTLTHTWGKDLLDE